MDNYYEDVYLRRLNRFGNDYQSRIQGERQKVFEQYLYKSVYQVDFEYGGEIRLGSLEPYKQNETKTLHYLLTELDVEFAPGTILSFPNQKKLDFEEPDSSY